jgi:hypothetical protein
MVKVPIIKLKLFREYIHPLLSFKASLLYIVTEYSTYIAPFP